MSRQNEYWQRSWLPPKDGEFCVTVELLPGLLVYRPSWLKALAVQQSRTSGRLELYASLP